MISRTGPAFKELTYSYPALHSRPYLGCSAYIKCHRIQPQHLGEEASLAWIHSFTVSVPGWRRSQEMTTALPRTPMMTLMELANGTWRRKFAYGPLHCNGGAFMATGLVPSFTRANTVVPRRCKTSINMISFRTKKRLVYALT